MGFLGCVTPTNGARGTRTLVNVDINKEVARSAQLVCLRARWARKGAEWLYE